MKEQTFAARLAERVTDSVSSVIVGKRDSIRLVLVAALAETHVLLEDVPGIGKTALARAFARSLGLAFSRIQFTPDLLPSDVTGVNYFNQRTQEFQFRPGPIMAGIVLGDEINRATPRTQSSLLEAMQERQVTIDGQTHTLDRPFLVLATQNPVEMEGTFPLPEAQLDRFGLCVRLGYPTIEQEDEILMRFRTADPLAEIQPVASRDELLAAQDEVRTVHVGRDTRTYLLSLVHATRSRPEILLAASPRASMILFRCAQALAAMSGRRYVLPDDIQFLAGPVLAHRLVLRSRVQLRGHSAAELIAEILAAAAVPVERERERQ